LEHANCPSRKMPCLWKATRKNTIQTKHAPPTHVCWFMDRFLLVYRQKKCVMFSITQPPTWWGLRPTRQQHPLVRRNLLQKLAIDAWTEDFMRLIDHQ
jgi:hypothetical protein